ncbi:MAG: type I secretion system permease/ATPase [Alphaproteobacteria bacterium]|nr:type I secretion system permease/ATPase [Alphaproteobacteria bacterium]
MNRFGATPRGETELQRALRACTSSAVIIAAFSLCINLLTLVSPLYMMQLFDRVLSSRSNDTLLMLTVIAGAALAVLSIIEAIRSQILSRIGTWLDERMGPLVLGGALQTALRNDSGRIAGQGLRDLGTLRGFLTGPAITPLLDAPWAPLFLLSLFALHPVFGLVGLGGGILLTILAILNEVITKRPLHRANAAAARTQQRTESALRNAEVIRAMGMLDGIVRLWRRDSEATSEAAIKAGNRGAAILAISKFLRLSVQTMIMGVGAYLVIAHDVSPGAMFASSFLLGRAMAPVENAIGTWKSLVATRIAYRRLTDLLGASPAAEKGMSLPRPEGELSVERLTFVPPGTDAPTLRGVSFFLMPGEVLGIIGPSAAGKSTLARLIAGSAVPTAGNVRLDGADIGVWLDADGARHLGYLPQDIELFAGTVRENIGRLGDAEPSAVVEAAKLAGLHEMIMRLPRGYDSEIGEAGLRLSGGQRQRVALARALFGRPRLVVLDEPNSSLDHEGEEALLEAIAQLKERGTTVVVIAHRPSILQLADKLLVLRAGAVDLFGERGEVIAKLNGANAARAVRGSNAIVQKQSA